MATHSQAEVASWLSQRFERLPQEYESGRQEIAEALAAHLGCKPDEVDRLIDELERAGYVRYAAEARSIGGSAGSWMIYTSPSENPEDETLGRAVSEQSRADGPGSGGDEKSSGRRKVAE